MATNTESHKDDRAQFVCGICLETYTKPRYLPTCGHTFCEQCLLTYASNLQQEGSKLQCPVCRKSHRFPENNEVTLDWIQTFPLNTVIIQMMESLPQTNKERAEKRRDCDACKEGGEIIVAVKFCMDCKETMCETCTKCHKRFKATSGHKLIDIKELSTKASSAGFFDTFTKCPDHPERDADFYCKSHDVVICASCILSNHGKPCNVVEVSNAGTDSANLRKKSEELTLQMKRVIDHVNLLQKLRKENKTNLKLKLIEIRGRINGMREQVVKLMDDVVSHVSDVTKQIEIENDDKFHEGMNRVSKIKEDTEEKLALLDQVEQHGSERHRFISAHVMKTQLKEISRQITEEDSRLRIVDAEMKVADDIRKLIENSEIKKLVQVNVNESEGGHKRVDPASNHLRNSKLDWISEHTVRPNAAYGPEYSDIAKKSKKPQVITKSSLLLDVRPWDDETDMREMARLVRTITMDGLLWGQSKLVPVGYGIRNLQIAAVIENDKVSIDDLEDSITAFEDLVQSMDIVALYKI